MLQVLGIVPVTNIEYSYGPHPAVLRHWAPFENQGLTKIRLELCGVIGWIGDILGSD